MKKSNTRRLSIMRIAITASVVLGIINIILVGAAYQRQSASQELAAENNALIENINSIKEINQDELDSLQDELDLIRSEVAELEASFPELGAPFAIYKRAPALAEESKVDLLSIAILSTDIFDTYEGSVEEKQYSLDLAGTMEDCISFISELEQAGRDTISMKSVYLLPLENSCSIEVSLRGIPAPAAE